MIESKKHPLKASVYFLYCLAFYFIWSIRELILEPFLVSTFDTWAYTVLAAVIKLSVWTVPAILMINYYDTDIKINLRTMLRTKVKWFSYFLLIIIILTWQLISSYLLDGRIELNLDIQLNTFIEAVLIIGVTEEVVFRGWLLNVLLAKERIWLSLLINSIMFAMIHFPIWIYQGMYNQPLDLLYNSLGIMVLSLMFSWSFIKSKNIFVPILLHMIWNLGACIIL